MLEENGKFGKDFLQKAAQAAKTQNSPVILQLEIYQDGTMNLKSALHPKEVIKVLHNTADGILFEMFEPKKEPFIKVVDE